MLKQIITISAVLIVASAFAQQKEIPKDTSFTVYGTWIKEKKKRPYIEIASVTKPKNVLLKKDVVYKTIYERNLLADVFYPKKAKKANPAVLLIFGGGWRSGDKIQNHAMAIELAKQGYVAVSAEYRLSLEATYPAAVHDLKAAIKWMKANAKIYGIDTNKITTLGCSAGGQLAALIGTTNGISKFDDSLLYNNISSKVHAVVNIDGTLAFHHPESIEGSASAFWFGGNYQQQPKLWEEAAPLNHVNANTVPFIFINSSIPRFHAGRDDMIKQMDSLKIYTELHTMNDTPHPFWFFHPWFNPMMKHIVSFLNKLFK